MSLLDRLKSALGLAGSADRSHEESVAVTVDQDAETGAGPERMKEETETPAPDAEEPALDPEPEPDSEAIEADSAEPADETPEPADNDREAQADDGADAENVTSIDGVGPAYGERLASAGITTVGDLAEADIDAVVAETDLSETRLERWVAAARDRVNTGNSS